MRENSPSIKRLIPKPVGPYRNFEATDRVILSNKRFAAAFEDNALKA